MEAPVKSRHDMAYAVEDSDWIIVMFRGES